MGSLDACVVTEELAWGCTGISTAIATNGLGVSFALGFGFGLSLSMSQFLFGLEISSLEIFIQSRPHSRMVSPFEWPLYRTTSGGLYECNVEENSTKACSIEEVTGCSLLSVRSSELNDSA